MTNEGTLMTRVRIWTITYPPLLSSIPRDTTPQAGIPVEKLVEGKSVSLLDTGVNILELTMIVSAR